MTVRLKNLGERTVGVQFVHHLHNGIGQRRILESQRFGMRIVAGQCDAKEILALAAIIERLLRTDERAINLAGGQRLQYIGISTKCVDIDRRLTGFLQRITGCLRILQIDCTLAPLEALARKILGAGDRIGILLRDDDSHCRRAIRHHQHLRRTFRCVEHEGVDQVDPSFL